ncbi:MAG TPA: CHRD domain-containing protein [Longimicrobiaceae bacterium]
MRLLSVSTALLLSALVAGCAPEIPTEASPLEIPVVFSRSASTNFGANLSGDEEVPPNDSKGRGHAQFWLSKDGTSLQYKLIVANIENVTQAHIHIAPEGVNGPVVTFLFGFVAGGVTQNGVLAEGTITQANLIARPAIGFTATMASLLAAMRSGNAYVNVHTVQLPAGEIRGQVHEHGPTK